MMLAVRWSAISLSKISTSSLELTATPLPAGTLATGVPLAPKLPVLLPSTRLPYTRTWPPACSRAGMLNTRMPPVLWVARLP